jgi:hypothetical protein
VIVLARNLRACKLDAVVAIAQIQRGVDSSRLLCCSGRVGRGDRVGDQAISGAPMPDEWFGHERDHRLRQADGDWGGGVGIPSRGRRRKSVYQDLPYVCDGVRVRRQ